MILPIVRNNSSRKKRSSIFFKRQQRKALLRNVALNMVDRFAAIAGLVGGTPLPVADMLLLTPLQMLMVAMVGGLSCRSMTTATAGEFMTASGATVAAGFALREVARQAVKFVPFLGAPVAGGIAYSGTHGRPVGGELLLPRRIAPATRVYSGGLTDRRELGKSMQAISKVLIVVAAVDSAATGESPCSTPLSYSISCKSRQTPTVSYSVDCSAWSIWRTLRS